MKELLLKVEFYGYFYDKEIDFSVEVSEQEYNQLKARIQKHKDYSFSNLEDDMPELSERILDAMWPLRHDFYVKDAIENDGLDPENPNDDDIPWEYCEYKIVLPTDL